MNRKPYDNKLYLNLIDSCKLYGYVKNGRGMPSWNELYKYIYANINTRDPSHRIVDASTVKPRKYNNEYYKTLVHLARQNGYIYEKVGKISIKTFVEYLTEKGIQLPEQTVVMNQTRIHYSQCKIPYSRLLFQAKALGYKQTRLGRPYRTQLLDYINQNTNTWR